MHENKLKASSNQITKKEDMMKRSFHIFAAFCFLTFGLAPFVTAQMMTGGTHGNMPMNKADSTSSPDMMGTKIMTMMGDLSGDYNVTVSDFEKLEEHFNKMMQITDMDVLKAEMKKHQNMMTDMHKNMIKQKGMFKNMMSSMQKTSMHGMMGEIDKATTEYK